MSKLKRFEVFVAKLLEIRKIDRGLGIALILGLALSLYGAYGGWPEDRNPDSMAFRFLFFKGQPPFEPYNFLKPPFHTYFNYFLSTLPLEWFVRGVKKLLNISLDYDLLKYYWSKSLTALMFVGSIGLVFRITRQFFGLFSARILALIFATSAGFIVESQYLTADIPVTLWMLIAFAFAQNIVLQGKARDYALAGFFTGIATATKYNGLGVGIAIVVAHLLASRPLSWRVVLSKKLYLGLGMVIVGFLFGSPFSLISYPKFIGDFIYNYVTTPIYDGSLSTDTSYWKFFWIFREIVGFPTLVFCGVAFLLSFYFLFPGRHHSLSQKGIFLLLSVFLLYYYKFGSFPRLETRFVFPIVPFWLMLSGALWNKLQTQQKLVYSCLVVLLLYNLVCSVYVVQRFAADPRDIAKHWVAQNIPNGSVVESTSRTIRLGDIPNLKVKDEALPFVSGRAKMFEEFFKNDPWMISRIRQREVTPEVEEKLVAQYSVQQLLQRQPDYLILGSLYYNRFFEPKVAELYPSMQQFFQQLLKGIPAYKVVLDQMPLKPPFWMYPQEIEWVDNRITIFQKDYLQKKSSAATAYSAQAIAKFD